MRRFLKFVIGAGIFMCVYMQVYMRLYAEEYEYVEENGYTGENGYVEGNDKLRVNITLQSGETVLIKDGSWFDSAVPVIFTLPPTDGSNYYSISTDKGNTFGEYVEMDEDHVTLYPDDATGNGMWQIRFANMCDGIESDSEVFRICFDMTSPVIDYIDEEHFILSDNRGLGGYEVFCGGDVIGEGTFDEAGDLVTYYEGKVRSEGIKYGDVIQIVCRDIAGNTTTFSYDHLTDDGKPVVAAEGVRDGDRLREGHTVHVHAADNESEAYVNYICERKTGDEVVTVSGFSLPADTDIACDKDGIYKVTVYASDSAGNESDRMDIEFVIDGTAPELTIGGVRSGVDERSRVKIAIGAEDNLYEDTEVNIKLSRTILDKTETVMTNSYKLNAYHDIREVDIIADGEYELSVSATDGAGNHSERDARFRIDKTAPDIAVSGIREGEMTNEKSMLRFDAGELFYASTVMSALLEKKEKEGYITIADNAHVMTAVRDHMDIAVENEGEYRLTCTASDRSGNLSQKTVAFTVDYTPPVISEIAGLQGRYFRSFPLVKRIADYVSDASAVSTRAYLNDRKLEEGQQVLEEGKYILTVIAEDAAANVSEETAAFIIDHTAPQIVLSGFDRNGNIKKGSMVRLSLLEEGDTLDTVRFGGRDVVIADDNSASIAVNEYGHYDLEVMAHDMAGNVTNMRLGTECYMYGGIFNGYTVEEKEIYAAPDDDIDLKGLVAGLVSVLSGTFGLTYRTYLSGKQ